MIETVIFDIGNVLCNYAWYDFMMERTGGDEEMTKRLAAASVNHPFWPAWDKGDLNYAQISDGMCANDMEIADTMREVFRDIKGLLTPRAYAIPWVEKLHDAGLMVLFLSNMSRPATEQCPEALSFIPYTDGGILSFREHVVKPNKEIYLLLQKRYHLNPSTCVFIDDLPDNIEMAKSLGWNGIVFTGKEAADRALRELGVNV